MELVTFEGIDVDRCTGCKGLWFDSRENERLRDRRGSEVIDAGDAAVGRRFNKVDRVGCPRCSTPMVRMVDAEQSHIWYESCSVCGGVFLDAGEFRDFKNHSVFDKFRSLFTRARD